MKPKLRDNLFYVSNNKVYFHLRPDGVIRYNVYCSLEPLRLLKCQKKVYSFKDGEVLEVTTNFSKDELHYDRRFFQYHLATNTFEELHFEEIPEDTEGEEILAKHFGVGLRQPEKVSDSWQL